MHSAQSALFNTVPPQDYFHLFDQGEPNSKKIIDLLQYKKQDIATAACVPIKSVRYDNKMPVELKERITEWAVALNLIGDFFKDTSKTLLWFSMPNPLLGDMSPRDMIRVGRFKKLLKFIQTALDENRR